MNDLYRKQTRVIADSMINGQHKQAFEQLQKGCKTKPVEMAFRAGLVVMSLEDPLDYNNPDAAVGFMSMLLRELSEGGK